MKLDAKEYAEKSVLCWLATVSADVVPNVSPKEIFSLISENMRISEHSEQPFRYDPNTYFGLIRTHIPRLSEHF